MRIIQPRVMEDMDQPIVIENRPGANGFIGSQLVARAGRDGYTLLASSASPLVSGAVLSKNMPFDPVKDFTPITTLTRSVNLLVVRASVPVDSVSGLIDYAKHNPGKLYYGSTGIGSIQHLDAEGFKLASGVDMVHVPYKGFGPVVQAILSGEVQVTFVTLQFIQPQVAAGKIKVLAVYDGNRYPGLSKVPDLTETLPEFRKSPSWIGILGPAGLPRPIVSRLHGAIVNALKAPEVRASFEDNSVIVGDTPEQFAASLKNGLEQTAKLQNHLHIQLE